MPNRHRAANLAAPKILIKLEALAISWIPFFKSGLYVLGLYKGTISGFYCTLALQRRRRPRFGR